MRGECGQWGVASGQWQRTCALLLATGCWLLASGASAQTRTVEILGADVVTVEAGPAGVVRRLEGNVRLRQDTTALSARSVVVDEAQSLVTMRGDVRIVSGRNTLTATEVDYRSDTRVAEARQNVRVADDESTLTAPQATYDTRAEVSTFSGGGRITHRGSVLTSPAGTYASGPRIARLSGPVRLVDSTGVLTAARGVYDARIQRADFAGAVRLTRPDARLAADSLVYFRTTERARAYGRVALERFGTSRSDTASSAQRTFLFGETLLYDGRDASAQVRGEARPGRPRRDPLLVTLNRRADGKTDTTLVRAPRLDATRTVVGADTTETLVAAGGARLVDRRLAAVADSARVLRLRATDVDRIALFGAERPRAWSDGAQLTGDTLFVTARAGRVDTLLVVGRAFSAQVDSTVGRLQQIAGGRIQAFFGEDSAGASSLRRLAVWPNAETFTFRSDAAGRLAGATQLAVDSLSIRFEAGQIRDIGGFDGVSGTAYGPRIVPDLRLPGFAFTPADAPTRETLLDPDGWEAAFLRNAEAPGDVPAALPETLPPGLE